MKPVNIRSTKPDRYAQAPSSSLTSCRRSNLTHGRYHPAKTRTS